MITVISSTSKADEAQALRFVTSFLKHWPQEVTLLMWYHGGELEGMPQDPRVTYHNLDTQPAWLEFLRNSEGKAKSEDYRYDLTRFTPKLYSIFSTHVENVDWVIWLDSDIETYRDIPLEEIASWLQGDFTYLGRRDINYCETSFMAFNVGSPAAIGFLQAIGHIYHSGEVLQYKEFHDGWVIERLLKVATQGGLNAISLSQDVEGLDAFHQSPLGNYMVHFKGPAKEGNPTVMVPEKYGVLNDFLEFFKPQSFYFQTRDANRIFQLLAGASRHHSTVVYSLKDSTAEISARITVLRAILAKKNVELVLNPGNYSIDMTYHDGHGVIEFPTCKVFLMDNYVGGDKKELRGPSYRFDQYFGEARKQVGAFNFWSEVPFNLSKPLRVQPKNAVDHSNLIENVKANTPKFQHWVKKLEKHEREAILISAGPTLKKEIGTIKQLLEEGAPKVIFTVKHALPMLLKEGITPDICVILDARPLNGTSTHNQVRKSLYENVPETVAYYIATMCAQETTDHLMASGSPCIGWHAANDGMMQAGLEEFKIGALVGGGTCAAWRAFAIAHILGFRTFHLFGYDFYYEKPEKEGQTSNDIMKVLIGPNKREFYTTGELVAALQDFEQIQRLVKEQDLGLYVYGDGMVAEVWTPSSKGTSWESYLEGLK